MRLNLKTNLFFAFLLFTQLGFMSSRLFNGYNYDKNGEDWGEKCVAGKNQSPIDISAPFKYKSFDYTFYYSNMRTEYVLYNDGNHLQVEGDFGYVEFDNVPFFSSEMKIFSPSMHTFNGKKMSLEIQVYHFDVEGNAFIVSILFKESKEFSLLLEKLQFQDPKLQSQKPYEYQNINSPINLSRYINESKDFFVYEGRFPLPPCETKATFFILTDVLNATKEQISNFPKLIYNQSRKIQDKEGREIWTTFKMEEFVKKMQEVKTQLRAKENDKITAKKYASIVKSRVEVTEDTKKKPEEEGKKDKDCDEKSKDDEYRKTIEEIRQRLEAFEKFNKINEPKFLEADAEENAVVPKETQADNEQKSKEPLKILVEIDRELPPNEKEKEKKKIKRKIHRKLHPRNHTNQTNYTDFSNSTNHTDHSNLTIIDGDEESEDEMEDDGKKEEDNDNEAKGFFSFLEVDAKVKEIAKDAMNRQRNFLKKP